MTSVRLFGSFEIDLGAQRLGARDLGGVKPKQLLELLVLRRGRAVPKDELADSIWGEALPRNVAATLESYVSVVRSKLGDRRGMLVTETGGYRVDVGDARVDLDEFDSLVQRAATGEPRERRDLLEQGLRLATGDVLADEPYADWALEVRNVYSERRVQVLANLAELCLVLGDLQPARQWAEEALNLDPVLERAHRTAVIAAYAAGDEERALLAYDRCRSALLEALGVGPTPETAAVHAAVLRREDPRSLIPDIGSDGGFERGPPTAIRTHYAHNGDVGLAYQVIGDGSPDLVFMPGFVSHVEAAWEDPSYSGFMRRLARDRRLIVFDKRGTGLSDPVVEWPGLDERVADMLAVMDAAGSDRAVLLGISEGAPLCARAAVTRPDRVAGLVLLAPWLPRTWEPPVLSLYASGFESAWTTGAGLEVVNPSRSGDLRYMRWFARYLRLSATPSMARRLMEMNAEIDVEDVLDEVRVPTLILHRTRDQWVTIETPRFLAERIPGAELVELTGVDHHPWVGEVEPTHAAIDRFIARLSQPAAAP